MMNPESLNRSSGTLLTHAGFPNPHEMKEQPMPHGLPVALGPQAEVEPKGTPQQKMVRKMVAKAVEPSNSIPKQVPHPVTSEIGSESGEGMLSEQVLKQKAIIAELEAKKEASAKNSGEAENAEEVDEEMEMMEGEYEYEYVEEDEEETDPGRTLESVLAKVTPCARCYPVTIVQSTERQRVETNGMKWTDVKGLRLQVKPPNSDDCMLLVANCMLTPEITKEESHWAIHRQGQEISPKFTTYSRQPEWSHYVCMPYLDQPEKRMENDYQVVANNGGQKTRFMISPQRQRRHFFAVTLPAQQVVWVEDDERQSIPPGLWMDIDGFYEVVTTLPGEKVLAICTLRYAGNWASELNRGRFTLVRDDVGLDGLADRGLQSVRALSPNLHRTAVMATIDEPPPGPHIYRARTALTVGTETGVTNVLSGNRQLVLIRLPGDIVAGPNHCTGPVQIDESTWMEIPGLSVSMTLKRPRDRVMIVYHTDCNPQSYFYEAHFTIFRRRETGAPTNLGFSEDFGIEMVFSDYTASSEYPVGIICDTPGSLGTWTYYLAARVANLGTSTDNPPVTVGYCGSISAVLLSPR